MISIKIVPVTKIRIFGSYHFNTRSIVTDDLRTFATGAEAIAVEDPRLGDSVPAAIGNVLRFPVTFVGMQLLASLFRLPLFVLFNRDLRSTEQLAARAVAADRPVHSVDLHPIAVLNERQFGWIVGNWFAFVTLGALFPFTVAVATGMALAVAAVGLLRNRGFRRLLALAALVPCGLSWELLVRRPIVTDATALVVPLFFVIAAIAVVNITLERRNEIMLEDVATLASEHGYDRVCLTTGKGHVAGMVDVAPSFGLTVADVFEPEWRRHGELRDPETVVGPDGWESAAESDDSDGRPRIETAGNALSRRAGATVIDWGLMLVGAFLILVAVVSVNYHYPIGDADRLADLVLIGWLLFPPVYFAVSEGLFGQTFGKYLAGLTVVRLDSTPCTFRDATVRTLFRPLDFLPIGYLLGAAVATRTRYGQRIGDLAAGTVVVERDVFEALETASDDPGTVASEAVDSRPRPQPSPRTDVDGTARAIGERREPVRPRASEASDSPSSRSVGSAFGAGDESGYADESGRGDESGHSGASGSRTENGSGEPSSTGVHSPFPTESDRVADEIEVDEYVFDTDTDDGTASDDDRDETR